MTRRATVRAVLAAALAVVVVPAALATLRTSEFRATAALSPRVLPEVGGPEEPDAAVRRLLESRGVENDLRRVAGFLLDPDTAVAATTVEAAGDRVHLTAVAGSPEHARDLADALAELTARQSADDVSEAADQILDGLEDSVESGAVDGGDAAVRQRMRALARLESDPPEWFTVAARASTPPLGNRVDRALDRLPGPFPPAVHPLLVAAAGLAVASALAVAVAVRAPRAGSPG